MRRKSWSFPGFLLLGLLLLFCFPSIALADETQSQGTEQTSTVSEVSADKPAATETASSGLTDQKASNEVNTTTSTDQKATDAVITTSTDQKASDESTKTSTDQKTVENAKATTSTDQKTAEDAKATTSTNQKTTEDAKATTSTDQKTTEDVKATTSTDQKTTEDVKATTSTDQKTTEDAKSTTSTDQKTAEDAKATTSTDQKTAEDAKSTTSTDQKTTEDVKATTSTDQKTTEDVKVTTSTDQKATDETDENTSTDQKVTDETNTTALDATNNQSSGLPAQNSTEQPLPCTPVSGQVNGTTSNGTTTNRTEQTESTETPKSDTKTSDGGVQPSAGNVTIAGSSNESSADKVTNSSGITESVGSIVKKTVKGISYLVRKGESLWLIGRSLGVNFSLIQSANGINDDLIYPGQKLVIPGLNRLSSILNYRIKKGDSFYFIGQALGIDFLKLMSFNNAKDIWIYPDQILKIPSLEDENRNQTSATQASLAFMPNKESDLYLLARAIYAEARGESFEGQVAVGAVILNRLESVGFPKTIRNIIFQTNAFTAVDDGQINLVPNQTALNAAKQALSGDDPSSGAVYYWNPKIATSSWIWSRPIIKQIGNHVFAR